MRAFTVVGGLADGCSKFKPLVRTRLTNPPKHYQGASERPRHLTRYVLHVSIQRSQSGQGCVDQSAHTSSLSNIRLTSGDVTLSVQLQFFLQLSHCVTSSEGLSRGCCVDLASQGVSPSVNEAVQRVALFYGLVVRQQSKDQSSVGVRLHNGMLAADGFST